MVGFLRGGRRTSVVVEDHHAACDEAAVCYRGRCGCLGGGDDSWLRVLCQHACRGASREQESGQMGKSECHFELRGAEKVA